VRSILVCLGESILLMVATRGIPLLGETPSVTVRDCVQVRYIDGVWVNRQGTRVAYVVRTPNIARNNNDDQVYVRDIGAVEKVPGRPVITGGGISNVAWLADGSSLAMLMQLRGTTAVITVNVETGKEEVAAEARAITGYSMNASGTAIAYTVNNETPGRVLSSLQTKEQIANGYRVTFGDDVGQNAVAGEAGYSLYMRHRGSGEKWGVPAQITIRDPLTHKSVARFDYPERLSLSPDGSRLLFNYMADIPVDWGKSPWVHDLVQWGNAKEPIMVLYELRSGRASLAFKTLGPDSTPVWSKDSASFLVNAHSPVGSIWEQEDVRDHRISGPDANMFWVNINTGNVEEVYRQVPAHHEGPMFWRDDGDVIIHAQGDAVLRLHRDEGVWRSVQRVDLPRLEGDRFWYLASSGTAIIGVHQTVTVPEDLFVYEPGERSILLLTDLNPQLKKLRFAPVKTVHWTTSEGSVIDGLLFMPPGYVSGERYPLVIQTKGDQGWFTCDSGENHDPAFAPQPMANAGLMYLIRTVEPGFNYQDDENRKPTGYPGQIGEAVQQMDIWDSAIKALSDQGMVDPKKVGIIGFSRTGWYVEFMLTQSSFHFAAATASDNVQYSLAEYWLEPTAGAMEEEMYGGPPYGKTLANWEDYSISFNLEKVHTPLLMERMGSGVHDDAVNLIPAGLAFNYEILSGLIRLGRPVELYYYPDEDHQPSNPKARLASLQRNVDWFRFWLQGYEDPASEKNEQYIRWRHLKTLQDAEMRSPDAKAAWHPTATDCSRDCQCSH
jgi:dipeptidyl aminopeptidase/acylaminoacyl peptidase